MRRPRRTLPGLISTMLLSLLVGIAPVMAQDPADPPAPLRALDLGSFAASTEGLTPSRTAELDELVLEATLADLQAAMANSEITSVELTTYYLSRINDLDVGGLQSMNELERYAPFGQNILEAAAGAPEVSREEYLAGGTQLREQARDYLDALVADNDLDVLVSSGNRLAGAYAVAGYPAITVPAGRLEEGAAAGLTFTGRYLEDGPLIGYAYAFEQASGLRVPPPVVTGG